MDRKIEMGFFIFVIVTIVTMNCFLGCKSRNEAAADKEQSKREIVNITPSHAEPAESTEAEPSPANPPDLTEDEKKELEFYEVLEPAKKVLPTASLLKVVVKDLGTRPRPVSDTIVDSYTDGNDELKYLVTVKEILFMGPNIVIKKRIPLIKERLTHVGISAEGKWIWQNYVDKKSWEIKVYDSPGCESIVYDENGRAHWKTVGYISAISPDGNRAALSPYCGELPEKIVWRNEDKKTFEFAGLIAPNQ
jgi:hypothetical protein